MYANLIYSLSVDCTIHLQQQHAKLQNDVPAQQTASQATVRHIK